MSFFTPSDFRQHFSINLNQLLDRLGAPVAGYGRASFVAEMFGISLQAASKWVTGASIPEPARYHDLCTKLGCTHDELLGDSLNRDERAYPSPDEPSLLSLGALYRLLDTPSEELHMLRISDDSMSPDLNQHDIIVYRAVSAYSTPGIYLFELRPPVLAASTSDRFLVRYATTSRNRSLLTLTPSNSRYSADSIQLSTSTPSDPTLIGKVVGRFSLMKS